MTDEMVVDDASSTAVFDDDDAETLTVFDDEDARRRRTTRRRKRRRRDATPPWRAGDEAIVATAIIAKAIVAKGVAVARPRGAGVREGEGHPAVSQSRPVNKTTCISPPSIQSSKKPNKYTTLKTHTRKGTKRGRGTPVINPGFRPCGMFLTTVARRTLSPTRYHKYAVSEKCRTGVSL